MLYHIINKNNFFTKEKETLNESNIEDYVSESIRIKIKFLIILMKMFKTVREEKEIILKLKGCCPGNKIPRGLIIQGPNALKGAYERYNKAKIFDMVNEKWPSEQEILRNTDKLYIDDI